MKEIKIGIFGGARGMGFYPIDRFDGFKVTAICDASEKIRENVKKEVKEDVILCETFEELLATGIDAVVLTNFFHEHAEFAIRAMEAGVDVISDTTTAGTLGECLDIIECVERTGRKYMLAANCPKMVGPAELERVYKSGQLGEVLYAEAEYSHPTKDRAESLMLAGTDTHWRRYLPGIYYNMHSLGVLMSATGLMPRRVMAMDVCTKSSLEKDFVYYNKSPGGIALYEMENGAVFRSTGCCRISSPGGKWFRLSCDKGTIETTRENQDRVLLHMNDKVGCSMYDPDEQYTEEEKEIGGHGGADARLCKQVCDYLSGKVEEPIFDIYRGVTLSLAGIYGLYSILDGKSYDIPDPRDKAAREVLRGDYRTPFFKDGKEPTLPFARYAK